MLKKGDILICKRKLNTLQHGECWIHEGHICHVNTVFVDQTIGVNYHLYDVESGHAYNVYKLIPNTDIRYIYDYFYTPQEINIRNRKEKLKNIYKL